MLNTLIAQLVVEALQPLNGLVISRLAGLVKVLETDAFTPGKVSKFPIPFEASANSCASAGKSFPDLVPDERERLIVYFEDFGAQASGSKWNSRLRLIGWGNATWFETDRPAELTPALVLATIVGQLKRARFGDLSPIGSLECTVIGTPSASTNLFERYSYSEVRSQFLLPPFFAFGLDLQLTYTLQHDCLDTLIGLPVTRC